MTPRLALFPSSSPPSASRSRAGLPSASPWVSASSSSSRSSTVAERPAATRCPPSHARRRARCARRPTPSRRGACRRRRCRRRRRQLRRRAAAVDHRAVEWLITVLFAPGKRWLVRTLARAPASTASRRRCAATRLRSASRRPAAGRLVLDYSDPQRGSTVWGRVVGMRDEVRLVAPGVYVGLGSRSLTAFGLGFGNCSAFVLWPAADRSR